MGREPFEVACTGLNNEVEFDLIRYHFADFFGRILISF